MDKTELLADLAGQSGYHWVGTAVQVSEDFPEAGITKYSVSVRVVQENVVDYQNILFLVKDEGEPEEEAWYLRLHPMPNREDNEFRIFMRNRLNNNYASSYVGIYFLAIDPMNYSSIFGILVDVGDSKYEYKWYYARKAPGVSLVQYELGESFDPMLFKTGSFGLDTRGV